jgi:hypothetical protein
VNEWPWIPIAIAAVFFVFGYRVLGPWVGEAPPVTGDPLCGNGEHPDGMWHPSTPIPYFPGWMWLARFTRLGRIQRAEVKRYERNCERWGCGCDSRIQRSSTLVG